MDHCGDLYPDPWSAEWLPLARLRARSEQRLAASRTWRYRAAAVVNRARHRQTQPSTATLEAFLHDLDVHPCD